MTAEPAVEISAPPLALVVNQCRYTSGYWTCTAKAHPARPDEHWMEHLDEGLDTH